MIIFKSVQSKNFFSVGNQPIKILLNKSPTTLVAGANGSGKSSTLLDAIYFSLFGKPFRNINKPSVINSINQGDCIVTLEFQIGQKEYKIIRGLKPNIFEIYENGTMINQDAASRDYQQYLEDSILGGLNERVFKQVVIMGSADYKPFMGLPAAQRREVIEELLDIKIFSEMLTIAKEKLSVIKESLKELDYKVELIQDKIQIQQNNKLSLAQAAQDKKKELEEKIIIHEIEITKLQQTVKELSAKKVEAQGKIIGHDILTKTIKDLDDLNRGLCSKHRDTKKTLDFFQSNDDCPTCKQHIVEEYKNKIITENSSKHEELSNAIERVTVEMEKKRGIMLIFERMQKNISKLDTDIYKLNLDISSNQKYITNLQKDISNLHNDKAIVDADDVLKQHEDELSNLKDMRIKTLEDRQYLEIVSEMLKDGGIKTKIIKQYIPIMNKIINDYLVRFALPIEFNLDDQFNEVIKSRFRDSFQYNNFSEGEKQRIDTALLLAWRQLARNKNTTNCNILIMDETFDSSLDLSATEELLNILLEMDKNTNIFIVSHKQDLGDKLRSTITFAKQGNFTKIAK